MKGEKIFYFFARENKSADKSKSFFLFLNFFSMSPACSLSPPFHPSLPFGVDASVVVPRLITSWQRHAEKYSLIKEPWRMTEGLCATDTHTRVSAWPTLPLQARSAVANEDGHRTTEKKQTNRFTSLLKSTSNFENICIFRDDWLFCCCFGPMQVSGIQRKGRNALNCLPSNWSYFVVSEY